MQLYERHNIISAIRQATTDQLVQSLCDHELDCVLGRASAAAGRENLWHEVLYTQRPVLIGHDKLLQRLHGRRLDWRELARSEEHTSELQSLMRISYAVFCLTKKNTQETEPTEHNT